MKNSLRAIALPLILMALTGSSQLYSQILFPQEPGLVDGKREIVCPHSSARALMSFVSRERTTASSVSENLYGGASQATWAYLDIGSSSVPTLMPDGSTLDYRHENNVDFISYWKPDGSVDKSFWARRFDRGSILTSRSKMLDEGVDDFSAISAAAKTKKFTLVQGELATAGHRKDLVWTNTISSNPKHQQSWPRPKPIRSAVEA